MSTVDGQDGGVAQTWGRLVLRGEGGRAGVRPDNADVGVVPEDCSIVRRLVEGRTLVDQISDVRERAEPVGEAGRYPQDQSVFLRELLGVELAEGRRPFPDVDGYVEQRPLRAAHELPLGIRLLIVEPPHDTARRPRVVVLNEDRVDPKLPEPFGVVRLHEEAAGITMHAGLEKQNAGE